ncbi:hypothetical protein Pmani_032235 [Petrolisthes manimaculis]|uniref:Cytochrome P450 n=1 Tax=Petrolisthes manimaculis TaxID=1843537 RepID=A0AAE1NS29_9EUCA|nr:hypothetical protein Pmani_032235 [Petrolisthes manimaculis]
MFVTVVLVLTVLVVVLLRANTRPPAYPPGPFALPFVGNVMQILWQTPKVALTRYANTYGGVMSFRVFSQRSVLISDPDLMRTALADPAFSGRIDLILFRARDKIITGQDYDPLGILGTSGEAWKSQRRFTLRTLKDLGLGRQTLEPIMQSELEELIDYFRINEGRKTDIGLTFNRSIVNVIWAIVIGKRFSHSDTRLGQLVDKVNKMLQSFNPFHPALRFRWVKKFFPNLDIIVKTEGYMKEFLYFIEEEMAVHTKETGGGSDTGSYIGAYQQCMQEAATQGKDTPLTMSHLKANILELFLAGSETTSNTLLWGIYLLASNPDIQRKVQEELDQVVGREHTPTLQHIDSLPYTTATIYEVQRMADLIPFSVPHETTENATIGDYNIPKGTCVMFNLSHGLKGSKYWQDPKQFSPQHFLTDDGKVVKPDHFLPFGYGKRVCLGESMARLELFLFLTTLVHKFWWRLSDDDPVMWGKHVIFNRPPDYIVFPTCRRE